MEPRFADLPAGPANPLTGVTKEGTHHRIPSPEGRATPPGSYDTWDAYMLDVELLAADGYDREQMRAVSKALRLAPNIDVFRALLDGQPVPVGALEPDWARRYGLL